VFPGTVSRTSGTVSESSGTLSRTSGTLYRTSGTVSRSSGTVSGSSGILSARAGTYQRLSKFNYKEQNMSSKNWVPRPDVEFDAFFKKYCQGVTLYTSGGTPIWTHVPADRVTELNGAYADWYTAWGKLKSAHTSGDVTAKDEARAEDEGILKDFNRQYVRYAREVTDAQRRDLGCPVDDPTHSPIPRPWAQCQATVRYLGPHLLELAGIGPVPGTMSDEEAKAEFGVRIFWGILGGEPTAWDKFRLSVIPLGGSDLPHSTFTHRKKYRFDFDGDSGKTVYFCLRYENEKGGREGEGPFGPIFSAIIP
jgi:hypothetical protein